MHQQDRWPRIMLLGRAMSLEGTTMWSFPTQAEWNRVARYYKGNFAPQVARNLILRYTREKDWVLDLFSGSGTTLVECRLLGRNGMGIDTSARALRLSQSALTLTPSDPIGTQQQVVK